MRGVLRVYCALGVSAFAAEQDGGSSQNASATSAEDAIARATREIELLTTARDARAQAKSIAPSVSTPQLPPGASPEMSPVARKSKPAAVEKKSANWLVDAMENTAPGRARETISEGGRSESDSVSFERGSGRDDAAKPDQRSNTLDPEHAELAKRQERQRELSRDEPTAAESTPVFNPLASFLGQWMTARDFSLLKPVVEASRTDESPLANGTTVPGGITFSPAGKGELSRELRGPTNSTIAPMPAKINPYLDTFAPRPTTFSSPQMPPPALPPTPPVRTTMDSASDAAKPRIPDFAKPLDDEKYFKPLKRF